MGAASHVIWSMAHRLIPDPGIAVAEEALVMTIQRWLRANERPIISGVDWDDLKRRALEALNAL
jgi:hypothetical protein